MFLLQHSSKRVKISTKVFWKNQEGLYMNSRPGSHQNPLRKSVREYGKNSAVKGSEFVLKFRPLKSLGFSSSISVY